MLVEKSRKHHTSILIALRSVTKGHKRAEKSRLARRSVTKGYEGVNVGRKEPLGAIFERALSLIYRSV